MSSQLIRQIGSALAEAYECPDQVEDITSRIERIVDEETRKRGPGWSIEQQVAMGKELKLWKERIPQEKLETKRVTGALNDLKFVLSYQRRGTTLKKVAKVASWASEHMTQVIAAIAVALAVILRASYSSFYEPLGLTPEEAGYDSGRILAQSLPGLLALVLLLLLAVTVISLPYQALVTARRERVLGIAGNQQKRGHMIAFCLLILVDIAAAWLFFAVGVETLTKIPVPDTIDYILIGALFGSIGGMIGGAFGVGIIWSLITVITWWRKGLRPYVLFRWINLRDVYLGFLPTIVALLLLLLPLFSIDRALKVQSGTSVRPMTFLSLPILGFTAELVTLKKKPGELTVAADDCVMYLGRTGDTIALYLVRTENGDVVGGDLIRVPSSELVISKSTLQGRRPVCLASVR